VYPGLAVAEAVAAAAPFPCRFFWIGSRSGMERAIVEGAGEAFPGGLGFYGVSAGKLRRNFSLKNAADAFRVGAGFLEARSLLARERPAILFSKGGFVSVPPCAAARSLGIPVFSHESDYSPGLATRINSAFSERVFLPYEETRRFFPAKTQSRLAVSGNPVRRVFSQANAGKGRAFLGLGEGAGADERILLALGGSQGSAEINGLVKRCLPALTKTYTVVHQTGERGGGCEGGPRYMPFPYIREELPHVIAAAELVLCRSGAGTLWECAFLGKPLVLVPLRGSGTRGDQEENARLAAAAGAARVMEAGFTPEDLSRAVQALGEDAPGRRAMSEAAIRFARGESAASGDGRPEGAAAFIASEIIKRVKGRLDA